MDEYWATSAQMHILSHFFNSMISHMEDWNAGFRSLKVALHAVRKRKVTLKQH
jgi:hypothetical protein